MYRYINQSKQNDSIRFLTRTLCKKLIVFPNTLHIKVARAEVESAVFLPDNKTIIVKSNAERWIETYSQQQNWALKPAMTYASLPSENFNVHGKKFPFCLARLTVLFICLVSKMQKLTCLAGFTIPSNSLLLRELANIGRLVNGFVGTVVNNYGLKTRAKTMSFHWLSNRYLKEK